MFLNRVFAVFGIESDGMKFKGIFLTLTLKAHPSYFGFSGAFTSCETDGRLFGGRLFDRRLLIFD
jgi:hypothetical protein